MELIQVQPEYVFPDYPRIDNVKLAWDMAIAENNCLKLGAALLALSKQEDYSFMASELGQMAEESINKRDMAAERVMIAWLNNPKNPTVKKVRREYIKRYDKLATQGIDPYRHLAPEDRVNAPSFLYDWYISRSVEEEQATRRTSKHKKSTKESAQTYRYLPSQSFSGNEKAVRQLIFIDDQELIEPPGLIIDPRIVAINILSHKPIDVGILCERLGLRVTKEEDPEYGNQLSYKIKEVSPHTYDEISKNCHLTLEETYQKVQALMQAFREDLERFAH